MVLSIEGWLNGITALGVVIIDTIIGIYSFYKSRKLEAKLLTYAAATVFFIGLLWLGPATDLLIILITGSNITPNWIYGLLSYMWIAPAVFFGMSIGAELLLPEKKKLIIIIYLIIGILFEVFLFSNLEGSFDFTLPANPGEDIIDTSHVYGSPTFILLLVIILSVVIFNGFGFLRKALQSTGIIRKKFFYLSLGFILFPLIAAFDSIIPPGIALPFVRMGIIVSTSLIFMGLKT